MRLACIENRARARDLVRQRRECDRRRLRRQWSRSRAFTATLAATWATRSTLRSFGSIRWCLPEDRLTKRDAQRRDGQQGNCDSYVVSAFHQDLLRFATSGRNALVYLDPAAFLPTVLAR